MREMEMSDAVERDAASREAGWTQQSNRPGEENNRQTDRLKDAKEGSDNNDNTKWLREGEEKGWRLGNVNKMPKVEGADSQVRA